MAFDSPIFHLQLPVSPPPPDFGDGPVYALRAPESVPLFVDGPNYQIRMPESVPLFGDGPVYSAFLPFPVVESTILFDQTVETNYKLLVASNEIAFAAAAFKGTLGIVSHDILFDIVVVSSIKIGVASNSIAFTQRTNQLFSAPANSISFGQIVVARLPVRNQIVSQNIAFSILARSSHHPRSVENTILFSQTLARNVILNPTLGNSILFLSTVKRCLLGVGASSVLFDALVVYFQDPSSTILFAVLLAAQLTKGHNNALAFGQTVTPNMVYCRSLGNSVAFNAQAYGALNISYNCSPLSAPSTVSLAATGATTLVLRNPEFGNVETIDVERIFTRTRGNTIRSAQPALWPEETRLSFNIRMVTATEKTAILLFIQQSLGKLITYTDQDARIWEGVIDDPSNVEITEEANCNAYAVNFDLVATLV